MNHGDRTMMRVETHHYTDGGAFEQSLDVYRPGDRAGGGGSARPVVALVVGSAWLGHRPEIYLGTSWWNSAGPRAVARLGYTCVCIRHRGAFPRVWSWATLAALAAAAGLLAWVAGALLDGLELELAGGEVGGREVFGTVLATLLLLVHVGGAGCASAEEMQEDVVDALKFLHDNRAKLGLDFETAGEKKTGAGGGDDRPRLVLGGYSSGGHVCATIVRREGLWRDRGLPSPSDFAGAMLYISPVLATRSWGSGKWMMTPAADSGEESSASLPSLAPSGRSEGSGGERPSASMTSSNSNVKRSPTTWFTDEVVRMVFGAADAPDVPSPLHEVLDEGGGSGKGNDRHPAVPHVFVGCRNEVFGLTLLDAFFASKEYSDALSKTHGVDSRYRAVESDHWNVLGSTALRDALEEELGVLHSKMAGKARR